MFKSTSKRVYIDLDARKSDFFISEDRFIVMGSMTLRLNLFRLKAISSNTTLCLNFVEKCLNSSKMSKCFSSDLFVLILFTHIMVRKDDLYLPVTNTTLTVACQGG